MRAPTRGLPDVIRIPNHVGDLVMALPAMRAAPDADVVVLAPLAPLVALAHNARVIPVTRRHSEILAHARAIRDVRAHAFGVVLTSAFSTVAMFRLAGVRHVRATSTDGRRILLSDPVDDAIMHGRSRPSAYYQLVTGEWPATPPVPTIDVPAELRARWWQSAGIPKQKFVGVFPAATASSRRWDPPRFAELVRKLAQTNRVIVFGGPKDVALTREVAGDSALDMGGRTDLPLLAAALAECDLLITNDSGPYHVAGAVGASTLVLQGAADPVETGVIGARHVQLRHPELPCVPCVRNVCPRRHEPAGYVLSDPDRECMRLISVGDVESSVRAMLAH